MKKRILSTLLALTMCLTLLPTAAFAEGGGGTQETTGVNYLYYDNGTMETGTKADGEYYTVENSDSPVTWGTSTSATWYVVPKDTTVTINGTVTLGGDVHLILCDGATLTINGGTEGMKENYGIIVKKYDRTLTIYGQTNGTGTLAVTAADATNDTAVAARSYGINAASLTVNGGRITATAGEVTNSEKGTAKSCGIYATSLTVNGGSLTAIGGEVTSNDENAESCGIFSGSLTLSDGTVTGNSSAAQGFTEAQSYGLYTGCGVTVTGGTLTGKAGTVTVTGENGNAESEACAILADARGSYTIRIFDGIFKGMLTLRSDREDPVLTGGSFEKLSWTKFVSDDVVHEPLTALLGDNCAFQKTTGDGELVKRSEMDGELEKVKVVSHTDHSSTTEGLCDHCGRLFYLNEKGKSTELTENYTVVTSSTTEWTSGWYVVTEDTTINGTVNGGEGAIKLILCDGATLTVNGGISLNSSGTNAYVYAQSNGSNVGKLVAAGKAGEEGSWGINVDTSLYVYGGDVTGQGGTATNSSYGIKVKSFTVYGGTVTATGGTTRGSSYGIYANRELTVSGGTLKATSGDAGNYSYGIMMDMMTVTGGTVTVASGKKGRPGGVDAGQLIVSGGTLKLTEGSLIRNSLTVKNSVTLGDLLADGCAYQLDGNDAPSKLADLTSPLNSVKIVTHDHDYESGKCVYCGTAKHSSGGSGSSSNTTSTTVKNEDGSTTVTKTDKTTGTVTETTTTPNGTTSTTVTDKNGNSTTTVSVSKKDTQSGNTVTLPVDEVTAGSSENATEITVNVPSGGATVEIPVKNPTAGTVIVIVDEEGNETVLPGTKLTENGVTVTLTGKATIKVIRNGQTFDDVKESDYFYNAVLWASSRNITGGIGGGLFGPHESCSRAQLVTFLWRAAGMPESNNTVNMADVDGDSYYTDAIRWAVEMGIVTGYDNGLFGTEDPITREQMAVILYRFAKVVGIDTTQGGMAVREYADYESISGYARAAVQWAVNAGVMQGYDGRLVPSGECSRGQIVTMLYRLLAVQ